MGKIPLQVIEWAELPSLKPGEYAIGFDRDVGLLRIVKKSKDDGYFVNAWPESEECSDTQLKDNVNHTLSLNGHKYDSFIVVSREIVDNWFKSGSLCLKGA